MKFDCYGCILASGSSGRGSALDRSRPFRTGHLNPSGHTQSKQPPHIMEQKQPNDKCSKQSFAQAFSLGIAVGAGVGTALGVAMHCLDIGIAIGVGTGVAFTFAFGGKSCKKDVA
jgi:hypothetical protein